MRNGISFPACPNAVRMANSIPPQHGTFGAHMQVASVNDGPVTMIVDTRDLK